MSFYIGIVGKTGFMLNDYEMITIQKKINDAISNYKEKYQDDDGDPSVYVVGGLRMEGLNLVAYNIAQGIKGCKYIGIESKNSKGYFNPLPNLISHLVEGAPGSDEESEAFLKNVDVLIGIGASFVPVDKVKIELAKKKGIPTL